MESNSLLLVNIPDFNDGVCVCHIQDKARLSQSTISQYLVIRHKVDLVTATRIGKWTYYKRDKKAISTYIKLLKDNL